MITFLGAKNYLKKLDSTSKNWVFFYDADFLTLTFNYSIGTLEYEKSAVSASTKMSLGNNYSSSSSLQSLYYSQGAYINLRDGDSLTFSVNNNFKNVVNGVYGLVSNYKIGEVSFTDECGERRSFMLELDSSGSFLESLSIDQNNVIF